MVLHGATVQWEQVRIGEALPILVKEETQETIDAYGAFRRAVAGRRENWRDLHSDPEFARQNIFGTTVNMGTATADYCLQLLEKAFPRAVLLQGGRFTFKATAPICAGDTVTITGRVTDKRVEEGRKVVACELTATNQRGQVVYWGQAVLPFP